MFPLCQSPLSFFYDSACVQIQMDPQESSQNALHIKIALAVPAERTTIHVDSPWHVAETGGAEIDAVHMPGDICES